MQKRGTRLEKGFILGNALSTVCFVSKRKDASVRS